MGTFNNKENKFSSNLFDNVKHRPIQECDTNHANPISETISDKLYNSIVAIKLNNGIIATGFFMIIKIRNELIKCLLTCKHVISEEHINNKITINFNYG